MSGLSSMWVNLCDIMRQAKSQLRPLPIINRYPSPSIFLSLALILKLLTLVHGPSQLVKSFGIMMLTRSKRKPADLAILNSSGADAGHVEQEIVEVSQKDDYTNDFAFTPIHAAVLGIYDPKDLERPTLEQ